MERYLDQGRIDAATRIAQKVLAHSPDHPLALQVAAQYAQKTGDLAGAATLWGRRAALTQSADDFFKLAQTLFATDSFDQALSALEQALLRTPASARAKILRDAGLAAGSDAAARLLTLAVVNRDAEQHEDTADDAAWEEANRRLELYQHKHNTRVSARIAEDLGLTLPPRWSHFLAVLHALSPRSYADSRQQPDFHYYPEIEARPFWPRERFPWLTEMEHAADVIRDEYLRATTRGDWRPYVDGAAADGPWAPLSGTLNWASMHLFKGGSECQGARDLCPQTMALLDRAPLARAPGHAPEVFFSVLEPGAHIPPHYGVANTKLAIHLPLVVPTGDLALVVGGETGRWSRGECLVFDDSFLHEAWNRTEQTRVVLIFETWHPDLSAAEVAALEAVIGRGESWYQSARGCPPTKPSQLFQ